MRGRFIAPCGRGVKGSLLPAMGGKVARRPGWSREARRLFWPPRACRACISLRIAPPPPAQAPRIRMTDKPFAPACERNRDPILAVLSEHFAGSRHVLDVGSGTGQHAVHFAATMPLLRWQCSDQAEQLPGIRAWLDEAALDNTPLPLALDVSDAPWQHASPGSGRFDAMFSANTLHIMGWDGVEAFFRGVGEVERTSAGG